MMKKKILFVCVGNSNRSQMCEAFANIFGTEKVEAYSAGSEPTGKVNPRAIEAMKEWSYDLSTHKSKSVKEVEQFAPFDIMVTMGCGDTCPRTLAKEVVDWDIPDPEQVNNNEEFNSIRDHIRDNVSALISHL